MLTAPLALSQAAFKIDVPSLELADALRAVGRQTGTNIIFEPSIVKGIRAAGLRAELTADQAIGKLLEGTQLRAQRTSKDTIVVLREKKPVTSAPPPPAEHVTSGAQGDEKQSAARPRQADQAPPAANSALVDEEIVVKGLPEVLISAGHVLNMDIKRSRDDPQPYVIFDRDTIASSGAANLEDFMKQRLPMETTSLSDSQTNSFLGARSSINLRGLGTDQTLILIDGHRMADTLAVGGV
jgi:hypothetical protein